MTGSRVALVGAGPGDPDLLTLRAEAQLAAAGTVVSDAAVERLARRFAPRAEVVVVPDALPAVPILLAAVARSGRDVVRLYAGDPWLHPAHGPELAALSLSGIASEPVAGVATEVAVPALAGIAVHVRHLAVACTTGPVDAMPTAVDPARTIVVPTDDGVAVARQLATEAPHAPAALVAVADRQSVVRGTLADLGRGSVPTGIAASEGPSGPCLVVVGAVAATTGPLADAAHRSGAEATEQAAAASVEPRRPAEAGGGAGGPVSVASPIPVVAVGARRRSRPPVVVPGWGRTR